MSNKLTKPQRLVLEHLAANPEIWITANPPFARPSWTHWYAHRTPRITTSTFNSLHMRELIHAVKQRPAGNGWSEMFYYQISPKASCLLLDALVTV